MSSSIRQLPLRVAIPLACLVLSGMAGLVAEVVWSRALAALFGSALTATGLLLAIFMGGLGLGSALGARLAGRLSRPLAAFGVAELSIGSLILLTPWYFQWITPAVKRFDVRLPDILSPVVPAILTLPILGAIVVLMGTTFPLFVAFFARSRGQLGEDSGLIYGINTFGAVTGTILAGFWILPALGIMRSLHVAAALDFAVGAIALSIALTSRDAGGEHGDMAVSSATTALSEPARLAMLVAFLAGAASLALEVAWFRALMLIFGSSVYAISLMLAAFLAGIAGGAIVIARRASSGDIRASLGRMHWQIAFVATLVTFLIQLVPLVYISILSGMKGAFGPVAAGSFVLIAALLLVPTSLMGAALPTAIRLAAESEERHAASEAGWVYSASSVGSCAGAVIASFVALPLAGVRGTVAMAVTLSLAASFAALRKSTTGAARRLGLQAGVLTIAVWAAWFGQILPWDWRILTGGYYAYAHLYAKNQAPPTGAMRRQVVASDDLLFDTKGSELHFLVPGSDPESKLLSWEDGRFAQVAVVEDDRGIRTLLLNGKADASTGAGDMRTQLLLGHLPVLLAPSNPSGRALVIGLGSGVTGGAVVSWPFENVTLAEIEPAVVRAARLFDKQNGNVLSNPRVTMRVDDARRILDRSDTRYSLITSEPSNLWMSGVSLLFTDEFFQLASSRLEDRGVFCQWLHLYQVGEGDVQTLLATLSRSFPHTVAFIDETDLLIVASRSPLTLDPETWRARIDSNGAASAALVAAGISGAKEIASGIAADERGIRAWSEGARLHTDDLPILEFTAARRMGFDESRPIISSLIKAGIRGGPIQLGTWGSIEGAASIPTPPSR